jgi:hypothetical protein
VVKFFQILNRLFFCHFSLIVAGRGDAGGLRAGQKKTRASGRSGFSDWRLAMPYFRMANGHTIIGAKRFHFRVRDGIGWFTLAMVTKQTGVAGPLSRPTAWKSVLSRQSAVSQPKLIGCYMVKPHGQLVHVSCTPYSASTPCLST